MERRKRLRGLHMTIKFLGEGLQDTKAVADRLQDADPVMEWYLLFMRGLVDVLLPHGELHRNLQHSAK